MTFTDLLREVDKNPHARALSLGDIKLAHEKAFNFLGLGAPVYVYYDQVKNILHVLPMKAEDYVKECKGIKTDPGLNLEDLTKIIYHPSLKK